MKTQNEKTEKAMTETLDKHVETAIVKTAVDLVNVLNSLPRYVDLGRLNPELKKYRLYLRAGNDLRTGSIYEKQPDGRYEFKGHCNLKTVQVGNVKVYDYEGSYIQTPAEYLKHSHTG